MKYTLSEKNPIVTYYEECNNAYRDAWGMDKNMQLNLGLWKKETKHLSEALKNLNDEIAVKAKIRSGFKILDAGCGVGGTAIYLAKKFNCYVVGISLAPNQITTAKKNAAKAGVADLVSFEIMDYMNTKFSSRSFDAIIGIESICYAEPKINFLKEAYRLLKKGGLLVLAENLQAKERLTKKENRSLYKNAFNGCQVKSLDTKENYLSNLKEIGYTDFRCEDYTAFIKPSIRRLRRFYYLAAPYNFAHRLIGKRFSKVQEANTKMCYHLLSSLNSGLWSYGIISAKK